MEKTSLRQKDQIRSSENYNDNIENIDPSVHFPSSLEDDLNAIRSQLKKILGEEKWWNSPKISLFEFFQKPNLKWFRIEGNTGYIEPKVPADDLYIIGDEESIYTNIIENKIIISNILPYFKNYEDIQGNITFAKTNNATLTFNEGSDININVYGNTIEIEYDGPIYDDFNNWFNINTQNGIVSASRRKDELTFLGEGGIKTFVSGRRVRISPEQNLSTSGNIDIKSLKLEELEPNSIIYVDQNKKLSGNPIHLLWDQSIYSFKIGSEKNDTVSIGKNKVQIEPNVLKIFNILSPPKPINEGHVFSYGNKIVALGNDIKIYDFSNPKSDQIYLIGSINSTGMTGPFKKIKRYGKYIVGLENGEIFFIDLEKYIIIKSKCIDPLIEDIEDYEIIGSSIFYISEDYFGEIDVSNIKNPTLIRRIKTNYISISSLIIKDNYAFIAVEDGAEFKIATIRLEDFVITNLFGNGNYGSEIYFYESNEDFIVFSCSNNIYISNISNKNLISESDSISVSGDIDNIYFNDPYLYCVDSQSDLIRLYKIESEYIYELGSFDLGDIDGPENIDFYGGYLLYSFSSVLKIFKLEGLYSSSVKFDSIFSEEINVYKDIYAKEPVIVHGGINIGFSGLHIDEGSLGTDSNLKIGGNLYLGENDVKNNRLDIKSKPVIQKSSFLKEVGRVSVNDTELKGIYVENNIVYTSGDYLTVIDFSDTDNPIVRDEYQFPQYGLSGRILKIDDILYASAGKDQVYLFNAKNPDSLELLNQYSKYNYAYTYGVQESGSSSIIVSGSTFPFQAAPNPFETSTLRIYDGNDFEYYEYEDYDYDSPDLGNIRIMLADVLSKNYPDKSKVELLNLSDLFNINIIDYEGWNKYGSHLILSSQNENQYEPGKELTIIDFTDHLNPKKVYESNRIGNYFCENYIYEKNLYVINGNKLSLYDISDINNVEFLGESGNISGYFSSFVVRGKYLYGFSFVGSFYIYDISDISSPVLVSSLEDENIKGCYKMHLFGNIAICCCSDIDDGRIVVVDITEPESPYITQKIGNYPKDNIITKRDGFVSLNNIINDVSQTFKAKDQTIESIKLSLSKVGNPSGNIHIKIYEISGDFGSNATPTGNPISISNPIKASSLLNTYSEFDFIFSPSQRVKLNNPVAIVVEFENGTNINYINVGTSSLADHDGNLSYFDGIWKNENLKDLVFEVKLTEENGNSESFDMALEGNRLYVINRNISEIAVYDICEAEISSLKSGSIISDKVLVENKIISKNILDTNSIIVKRNFFVGEGEGISVEKNAIFEKNLCVGKSKYKIEDFCALNVSGKSFFIENGNIEFNEEIYFHNKNFKSLKIHNGILWGIDLSSNICASFSFNNNLDLKKESIYSTKLIKIEEIGSSNKINIDYDFSGEYLFVVYYNENFGYLKSLDITSPYNPKHNEEINLIGIPSSIDIYGKYAYICYLDNHIIDIFDISDPKNIVLTERNNLPQILYPKKVYKKDSYIFVFHEGPTNGISILRQEKEKLFYINNISSSFFQFQNKVKMEIIEDYIYFVNNNSFNNSKLNVIKISKIYGSNYVLSGNVEDKDKFNQISFSGNVYGFNIFENRIYINTNDSLYIYSIDERMSPKLIEKIDLIFGSSSNMVFVGHKAYNFSNKNIVVTEFNSMISSGVNISELYGDNFYVWSSVDVGRNFYSMSVDAGPGGLLVDKGNGLSTDSDLFVKLNSSIGKRIKDSNTGDIGNQLNIYGNGFNQIPQKKSSSELIFNQNEYNYDSFYGICDVEFYGNNIFICLFDEKNNRKESIIETISLDSEKNIYNKIFVKSNKKINKNKNFLIQVENEYIYVESDSKESLIDIYSIGTNEETFRHIESIKDNTEYEGRIIDFKIYGNILVVAREKYENENASIIKIFDITDYKNPIILYEKDFLEMSFFDVKINEKYLYYSTISNLDAFGRIDLYDKKYINYENISININDLSKPTKFCEYKDMIYFVNLNKEICQFKVKDFENNIFNPIIKGNINSQAIQIDCHQDMLIILEPKFINIFEIYNNEITIIEKININQLFGENFTFKFFKINKDSLYLCSNESRNLWRINFSRMKSPSIYSLKSYLNELFTEELEVKGKFDSCGAVIGKDLSISNKVSLEKKLFVNKKMFIGEDILNTNNIGEEYDVKISNLGFYSKTLYDKDIKKYIDSENIKNIILFEIKDDYIYAISSNKIFYILYNKEDYIELISQTNIDHYPNCMAISGNNVFVFGNSELTVLDINDKNNPYILKEYKNEIKTYWKTLEYRGITKSFVLGKKLYCMYNYGSMTHTDSQSLGFIIFDISDPLDVFSLRKISFKNDVLAFPHSEVDIFLKDNTLYFVFKNIINNKIRIVSYSDLDFDNKNIPQIDFDEENIEIEFNLIEDILHIESNGGIIFIGTNEGKIHIYSVNQKEPNSEEEDYISSIELLENSSVVKIIVNKNNLISLLEKDGEYYYKIINIENLKDPIIVESKKLEQENIKDIKLYNGEIYFCSKETNSNKKSIFSIKPNYVYFENLNSKTLLTDWMYLLEEGFGSGSMSVVNSMTLENGGTFSGGINSPVVFFENNLNVLGFFDEKNKINIGGNGLSLRYEKGIDYYNSIKTNVNSEGISDLCIIKDLLIFVSNWSEEIFVWKISSGTPSFVSKKEIGGFKCSSDGQFVFTIDNKTGHIRSYSLVDDGRVEEEGSLFLDGNFASPPIDEYTVRNGSGIIVEGKYAYVIIPSTGELGSTNASGIGLGSLFIIDISDPKDMKIISRLNNSYLANSRDSTNAIQNDFSYCLGIKKKDERLYISIGGSPSGLTIVDIDDKVNPYVLDVFFDGNDTEIYEGKLGKSKNLEIKGKWIYLINEEADFGYTVTPGGLTVLELSETKWSNLEGSSIKIKNHYKINKPKDVVVYNDYLFVTSDDEEPVILVYEIKENGNLDFINKIKLGEEIYGVDKMFVYGKKIYLPLYGKPGIEDGKILTVDIGGLKITSSKIHELYMSESLFVKKDATIKGNLISNHSINSGFEGIFVGGGVYSRFGYSGQKYVSFSSDSDGTNSSSSVNFGNGTEITKKSGNTGEYFLQKDTIDNVFSNIDQGFYILEIQGNIEFTGNFDKNSEISILRDNIVLHSFNFDVNKNIVSINYEYPLEIYNKETKIQIVLNSDADSFMFSQNFYLNLRRI